MHHVGLMSFISLNLLFEGLVHHERCTSGVQRACTALWVQDNLQQMFTAVVHGCSLTRSYAAQHHAQLAPVEQIAEELAGFPLQPSCLL